MVETETFKKAMSRFDIDTLISNLKTEGYARYITKDDIDLLERYWTKGYKNLIRSVAGEILAKIPVRVMRSDDWMNLKRLTNGYFYPYQSVFPPTYTHRRQPELPLTVKAKDGSTKKQARMRTFSAPVHRTVRTATDLQSPVVEKTEMYLGLEKQYKQLVSSYETQTAYIDQLENEKVKLTDRYLFLVSKQEKQEAEKHECEKHFRENTKHVERLAAESTDYSRIINYLQRENEDLKRSNEQLKEQRDEIENLRTELQQKLEENGDLERSKEQLQRQLKEQHNEIEKLKTELQQKLQENGDLGKSCTQLEDKEKEQQKQIGSLRSDLLQTERRNNDLQQRFSKYATEQLAHNKPDTAELSDPNRPTKLAEVFSKLYDNEWTEAFTAMENDKDTEKDIIIKLREILVQCFDQCFDISARQVEGIKALLLSPGNNASMLSGRRELTTEQANTVTDLRKLTTTLTIQAIKKEMARWVRDSERFDEVKIFVEKCTELCWLMVVQSPPVFIDNRHKSGDHFDKDIFKAYTKAGNVIEYVVWPPVYLHRGGPLLCKGTAQGKR